MTYDDTDKYYDKRYLYYYDGTSLGIILIINICWWLFRCIEFYVYCRRKDIDVLQ